MSVQFYILIPYPISSIGVSYFVYGEKIDVYSDDPKLKEFMATGLKFVRSLGDIAIALPLYKLHIRTRAYREYVDTLNKLQDIGMQLCKLAVIDQQ